MGAINIQKKNTKNKLMPIFLSILFIASTFVSLLSITMETFAVTKGTFSAKNVNFSPENQSLSMQYMISLSMCLAWSMSNSSANGSVGASNKSYIVTGASLVPTSAQIFPIANEGKVYINGKITTCAATLDKAMALWGFQGTLADFVTNILKCTRNGNAYECEGKAGGRVDNLRLGLVGADKVFVNSLISNAGIYSLYSSVFFNSCNGKVFGTPEEIKAKDVADPLNPKDTYTRFENNYEEKLPTSTDTRWYVSGYGFMDFPDKSGGTATKHGYTVDYSIMKIRNSDDIYVDTPLFGKVNISTQYPDMKSTVEKDTGLSSLETSLSCVTVADNMKDYLIDYLKYFKDNQTAVPVVPTISNKDPADSFNPNSEISTAGDSTETASCGNQAGPMAWVLCPILTTLSNVNSGAWQALEGLLKTKPLQTEFAGKSTPVYQAWGIMRNLSNILFVLMFLVLIFSQVTNIGIDNYGIKKLLPKIIVGAILINSSFLVMQIIFDVTNIIGAGLYDFLAHQIITSTKAIDLSNLYGEILAAAIGGGGAILTVALVGGSAAALWMMLPVMFGAALALLAAILTLIFRLAIVPMLAIVAPLAFVAYLLPNTTSLFKKWKDMLVAMLMIYPLAAIIFGGSQLVSNILNGGGFWDKLLAYTVLVLPLGSIPFIVSKSGSIVGGASKFLNGLASKAKKPFDTYSATKRDTAKAMNDEKILRDDKKGILGGKSLRRKYLNNKIADSARKNIAENNLADTSAKSLAQRLQEDNNFLKRYAGNNAADQQRAKNKANAAVAAIDTKELNEESSNLDNELAAEKAKPDRIQNPAFPDDPTKTIENPKKKTPDDLLLSKARGENGETEVQKKAAIHALAKMGRDKQIRQLMNPALKDKNGKLLNTSVNQEHIQSAIGSNIGALASRAPDLVKGAKPSFENVTANSMVEFSEDTVNQQMKYILDTDDRINEAVRSGKTQAEVDAIKLERTNAVNSFNNAIENIKKTPNLRPAFKSEAGRAVKDNIANDTTGRLQALLTNSAMIDPNGYIPE